MRRHLSLLGQTVGDVVIVTLVAREDMACETRACRFFERPEGEGCVWIAGIFPKEERPAGRAKAALRVIGRPIPPDLAFDLDRLIRGMRGRPEMAGLAPTLAAMADGYTFGIGRAVEFHRTAKTLTGPARNAILIPTKRSHSAGSRIRA